MIGNSSIAVDQLKSLVDRIEKLEDEKKALSADIGDVYGEAKASGFDVKVLRRIIALRQKDLEERREEEAILDLYKEALGMT